MRQMDSSAVSTKIYNGVFKTLASAAAAAEAAGSAVVPAAALAWGLESS